MFKNESNVIIYQMKTQPSQNFTQQHFTVSHDFLDRYQLACAKRIADILLVSPEKVLVKTNDNLEKWLVSDAFEKGEIEALKEWKVILQNPDIQEIVRRLTEDSDEGQRLRQSSPFVGILSKEEICQIREECEKAATF